MKKTTIILTRLFAAGMVATGILVTAHAADTTITAGATTTDSTTASATSHRASAFIKDANQGNRAEIALAELAQQKSQNADIKQLAEQLRDDHRQADQKLQAIAQAHGVTLDQELGWTQKHQQTKLEKLSGAEFDKAYATAMLKDHHDDIAKFQKASQDIQEADVKQFAQEILPKLQAHLQQAEKAARSAGVDQSTITSYTKDSSSMGGAADKSQKESGSSQQQQ
ncbi:MAG: putative rane protein [Verrucomicrobiota bacterium]|jgi:putative membrane protein